MRLSSRLAIASAVLATAAGTAATAFADSSSVGFPSQSSSCLGAITDYSAHYSQDGSGTPVNGVGYVIRVDAQQYPGNVGDFNKVASKSHGGLFGCIS